MEKLYQAIFDDDQKEKAIANCKEMKQQDPDETFFVILSGNKYYVESGIPFLRTYEKIIYPV